MDVNDDLDSLFDDNTPSTEAVAEAPTEAAGEQAAPEAPAKEADADKAPENNEGAGEAQAPAQESEAPAAPSEPPVAEDPEPAQEAPLTADQVRSIISDLRTQERNSGKELEAMESEVLRAYYPQGLSNVLVDERSGREIRTPQDVVDLSDGTMTHEEAAQWLMNEQYKLDRQINDIKQSARELAETNSNFKQGTQRVLEKYQPIFDKYPQLQQKVYRNYMKTVKMDNEKDLILSAPDIEDYYADVMEPYVMAFGYQAPQQPAPAAQPAIPESRQTAEDRMEVSGDGASGDDGGDADPNDAEKSLDKLFGE